MSLATTSVSNGPPSLHNVQSINDKKPELDYLNNVGASLRENLQEFDTVLSKERISHDQQAAELQGVQEVFALCSTVFRRSETGVRGWAICTDI